MNSVGGSNAIWDRPRLRESNNIAGLARQGRKGYVPAYRFFSQSYVQHARRSGSFPRVHCHIDGCSALQGILRD